VTADVARAARHEHRAPARHCVCYLQLVTLSSTRLFCPYLAATWRAIGSTVVTAKIMAIWDDTV
jgi:hypothetical protein